MDLYDILLAKNLGGGGGGVTPTGTKSITSNGTYDVKSYASADVNVPGIVPSGTYNITSNGTYNVTDYASASVSVTAPAVNIQALSVTENGTYTASGSVDGYSPVTVNVSGGGGGSHEVEDAIIERAQSYYVINSTATTVGSRAFYVWGGLTGVKMDNVTTVYPSAFQSCSNLSEAIFPKATSIWSNAFSSCSRLATISFPELQSIGSGAFARCGSLTTATFHAVKNVAYEAFNSCSKLMSLYLLSNSAASLSSANAFINTPMSASSYTGAFGSIYVPASLVDTYKSKAFWSLYSDRITSFTG